MTLEELYAQIGGDYEEALGRMRMEKLISKFIVKFLDDTSCKDIVEGWAEGDETRTFEGAHSAKGVCGNLALPLLAEPASQITEALRPGNEGIRAQVDIDALVARFAEAYQKTVEGITAYAAEL